jgi:flagellar hook-length control protein FliK
VVEPPEATDARTTAASAGAGAAGTPDTDDATPGTAGGTTDPETTVAPTTASPPAPPIATQPTSPANDADDEHARGERQDAQPSLDVVATSARPPVRDAAASPPPVASHTASAENPAVAQTPSIATPQPSAPPTQVAAPPAPAAPPNPVVTTPIAQVVSVVEPLRTQPDGSYRITVDLHPADLGRVQVEMKLDHGEVSLHLQAEHASTSTLLRDALHELRDRLQSTGLRTGGVVVGNGDLATGGGSGGRFDGDTARTSARNVTFGQDVDEVADAVTATTTHAPTSSDALVDVRV